LPKLPKMSKEQKQAINNSLIFVVVPDKFEGSKAQLQKIIKEYYIKDYPKLQSVVVNTQDRLNNMFETHPEYLDKTINIVNYQDFLDKTDKKPRGFKQSLRHANFYNNLIKLAEQNNPHLLAIAMLEYSGKIEDTDSELSIKLLAKAAEILDA